MTQLKYISLIVLALAAFNFNSCDGAAAKDDGSTSGGDTIYDIWFAVNAALDEDGIDLREKGVGKVTLCMESKITTVDYVIAEVKVDEATKTIQFDYFDPESGLDYPLVRIEYDYTVDAKYLRRRTEFKLPII